MHKYIKLFIVSITVLISFLTFIGTRDESSYIGSLAVPYSLILMLPIFMHYNYNKVKLTKYKKIYLLIMIVLYIINLIVGFLLIYEIFYPFTLEIDTFRKFYSFKVMISTLLFMSLSWLMLFLCFANLDKKENRTNFILTNLVCLLIISIHLNFYINPNLNLDSKSIINMPSLYITQNYIYFAFLYLMLIVNEVLVRN